MKRLQIAPIVEGDGEVQAVPILLRRLWPHLGGDFLHVHRPYRIKRDMLFHRDSKAFNDAVELSCLKLRHHHVPQMASLVLVLLDLDPDPGPICRSGRQFLSRLQEASPSLPITGVFADIEYESWFVAAAPSLNEYLDVTEEEWRRTEANGFRGGKKWIQNHLRHVKYHEPTEQPKLTARMDLDLCRANSPSFDKLCRELEKRLQS